MKYILIKKSKLILELYNDKKKLLAYTISVGKRNDNIKKIIKGDMRTPEGVYKIIDKKIIVNNPKYGSRWIRLNFPNKEDIITGYNIGLINRGKYKLLLKKYNKYGFIKNKTVLGFGIGIHGTDSQETIGSYETDGCIRMKNNEIENLYDFVDIGTKVIIK